ncbi:nuclease-related domain-containing protein [Mesorhizobium sp. B1-1-5]|uniref:nuclease-related domain-containing protein n=1 Tax=Mesorhizobium sp. B1-1-5 TaxID=2589979 RepID=UPI001129906E|nr:nuclease-related domain-containing protein [Mesorhizobium sp. B1-1-5]TPO01486.1 NERD domain-containing protein [Mesorhizobium sp. B1-1-5]
MPVHTYRRSPFLHTQENDAFDRLCRLCSEHLQSKGDVRVIGNVKVGQFELDALVLSPRSITIIDFKNYGGTIAISENYLWTTNDGTEIKAGAHYLNPFKQVSRYKRGLIEWLGSVSQANETEALTHISGLVLFTQSVELKRSRDSFSPKADKWFQTGGYREGLKWLCDVASNRLFLDSAELDNIIKMLGALPFQPSKVDQIAIDVKDALDRVFRDMEDARMQDWYAQNAERVEEQNKLYIEDERIRFEQHKAGKFLPKKH